MRYFISIIILSLFFSCGNKKVIQLPEINHSKITEIHDVSPAYIFCNESKKDSVEFNRKNLIGTTHWLVNIDRRLSLNQVIPHIKYLQNKRRNAKMHKNEKAKNYFTCNDTSINNLGFIEFTQVNYKTEPQMIMDSTKHQKVKINFNSLNSINVENTKGNFNVKWENLLETHSEILSKKDSIHTSFYGQLTFQNYITFKSFLEKLKDKGYLISNTEHLVN